MMQRYTIIAQHTYLAIRAIRGNALSGSTACRCLLTQLLDTLTIDGELIETNFPYYVMDDNGKAHFVSFSHSRTHIAVLLSNSPHIGVDIENKPVRCTVAQRYFAVNELNWLSTLPLEKQPTALNLLWTLKESLIKSQLSNHNRLFAGIRQDMTQYLAIDDLNQLVNASELRCIKNKQLLAGFLPAISCALLIG